MVEFRLTERDYLVLNEVSRWRFCLGRHIRVLAGFSGERSCDRRLKILIDSGYLEKKKIIYGIPSIYFLTYQARVLLNLSRKQEKIRIERIAHDITVLDNVIYFIKKYGINLSAIISEKNLQSKGGFGTRRHYPDFIFTKDNETYCVEIELSLKAKARLEKNIEMNYLEYDTQIWVVPSAQLKIIDILNSNCNKYSNIQIIYLEEVQQYVRQSSNSE